MERRFVLFLVLSFLILIGHGALMSRLHPPPPREEAEAPKDAEPDAREDGQKKEPEHKPEQKQTKPPEVQPQPDPEEPKQPPAEPPRPAAPEPESPQQWGTLGSADPADPYRMLATWTNKGAAISRIELNSERYRDLEDRSGYLGHVVMDETVQGKGCPVQVVGPGTPAAKAGLKPGDLITAVNGQPVTGFPSLQAELRKTKPGQPVTLTVLWQGERDVRGGEPAVKKGEEFTLDVTLERRPLEVVRPDRRDDGSLTDDPLSFLLTLHQIDDDNLSDYEVEDEVAGRPGYLERELRGLDLRSGNWVVEEADQTHVTFRRRLPDWGLVVFKTFRLEPIREESIGERDYPAYHLALDVKIVYEKKDKEDPDVRKVAYQLDGPTGLPTEGSWYARRGRDLVILKEEEGKKKLVTIACSKIAGDKSGGVGRDHAVHFIGIDAQYFSAVLIPGEEGRKFAAWEPLRVGGVGERPKNLINTSCRLVSDARLVKPGEALEERFEIFVGPKRPELLGNYGLEELVSYGWFTLLAKPMVKTLHFFYFIVRNYGLAILMLTVLVRGCMFPLSRKQALGAQKMQELQPELKKIQEKYKKDLEARTKAQQELFRKHNYNPLSGCLVLLIQLPIFIALYQALRIDIELRQAPLFWEGFLWCSNLAAPDMLFPWSGFMPGFIVGLLGPYFNLLPILTIFLFILQQKMFMPPPTDDQQAMQQKIMKYMMVFIGFLFFKVASGLCVYFIASSLWGLAERKFLPKTSPATPAAKPQSRAEAKAQAKPRPKPKPQPKPTRQQLASSGDGAAARRKKKKKSKRGKK